MGNEIKLFVNPGDQIVVHVIDDKHIRKNERGWKQSKIKPFKFSFVPDWDSVLFKDPYLKIEMQFDDEIRRISPQKDLWEDDREFPFSDWRYEVSNSDTRLGYWDWVHHKREAQKFEDEK